MEENESDITIIYDHEIDYKSRCTRDSPQIDLELEALLNKYGNTLL